MSSQKYCPVPVKAIQGLWDSNQCKSHPVKVCVTLVNVWSRFNCLCVFNDSCWWVIHAGKKSWGGCCWSLSTLDKPKQDHLQILHALLKIQSTPRIQPLLCYFSSPADSNDRYAYLIFSENSRVICLKLRWSQILLIVLYQNQELNHIFFKSAMVGWGLLLH